MTIGGDKVGISIAAFDGHRCALLYDYKYCKLVRHGSAGVRCESYFMKRIPLMKRNDKAQGRRYKFLKRHDGHLHELCCLSWAALVQSILSTPVQIPIL
jgi:hypothetical protein